MLHMIYEIVVMCMLTVIAASSVVFPILFLNQRKKQFRQQMSKIQDIYNSKGE